MKTAQEENSSALYTRFSAIEARLEELLSIFSKHLEKTQDQQLLIQNGIQGFKKHLKTKYTTQGETRKRHEFLNRARVDSELRYPHMKILEYLSTQFDSEDKGYKEINFNKLVREAKIGKNKAGEYLKVLLKRGYIEKRSDGYRVWYSLK